MAANRGHAEAQYRLGDAYEHGLYGLKRNEQEALKWYRQAAEGGDTGAQCRFGEAYEEGELTLARVGPTTQTNNPIDF